MLVCVGCFFEVLGVFCGVVWFGVLWLEELEELVGGLVCVVGLCEWLLFVENLGGEFEVFGEGGLVLEFCVFCDLFGCLCCWWLLYKLVMLFCGFIVCKCCVELGFVWL